VWSGNHHDLSAEQVDEAHSLGLGVYTWTVNDTADMERVIALGVDAITTDYPGRLVSLLRDMRS
jgi:glycerophosphoryl diester phosphodiesterase